VEETNKQLRVCRDLAAYQQQELGLLFEFCLLYQDRATRKLFEENLAISTELKKLRIIPWLQGAGFWRLWMIAGTA
jgi:hypothetical protein